MFLVKLQLSCLSAYRYKSKNAPTSSRRWIKCVYQRNTRSDLEDTKYSTYHIWVFKDICILTCLSYNFCPFLHCRRKRKRLATLENRSWTVRFCLRTNLIREIHQPLDIFTPLLRICFSLDHTTNLKRDREWDQASKSFPSP